MTPLLDLASPQEVAARQIVQIKTAWMFVGKTFQDGSEHCNEECPFYRSIAEVHPYGSGTATEYLCDCTLGQRVNDKPQDCPAWQAQQEEQQEAA